MPILWIMHTCIFLSPSLSYALSFNKMAVYSSGHSQRCTTIITSNFITSFPHQEDQYPFLQPTWTGATCTSRTCSQTSGEYILYTSTTCAKSMELWITITYLAILKLCSMTVCCVKRSIHTALLCCYHHHHYHYFYAELWCSEQVDSTQCWTWPHWHSFTSTQFKV